MQESTASEKFRITLMCILCEQNAIFINKLEKYLIIAYYYLMNLLFFKTQATYTIKEIQLPALIN